MDNPLSLNLYTYVENNPLTHVDPTGHEPKSGVWAGALIDFARGSGSGSQLYWDIKDTMGRGRQWGDVKLSRNQFLYLFNLATMTVCSEDGSCRNATEADEKDGYTAGNAEWAKQELMYAYDKEYVESDERLQDMVMGIAGTEARVAKSIKGWIKRETYKEIRERIGKEAQKKFAASMAKGIVGPEGMNGIKKLEGNGISGYMYEIKILGKGGDWRILGNMDPKTGHIIFEKLTTH